MGAETSRQDSGRSCRFIPTSCWAPLKSTENAGKQFMFQGVNTMCCVCSPRESEMRMFLADEARRSFKSGMEAQNTAEGGKTKWDKTFLGEGWWQRHVEELSHWNCRCRKSWFKEAFLSCCSNFSVGFTQQGVKKWLLKPLEMWSVFKC